MITNGETLVLMKCNVHLLQTWTLHEEKKNKLPKISSPPFKQVGAQREVLECRKTTPTTRTKKTPRLRKKEENQTKKEAR